jgi:biotin carboxyl carrier protein
MKMENVLKAAAPARIKSIEVKQGIAVEKGQILIKFD